MPLNAEILCSLSAQIPDPTARIFYELTHRSLVPRAVVIQYWKISNFIEIIRFEDFVDLGRGVSRLAFVLEARVGLVGVH